MAGKPKRKGNKWSGIGGMTKLRKILMRTPPDTGELVKHEIADFARKIKMTASRNARMGKMASARYAQAIDTKISRAGFSADIGLVTARGRKQAWFAHFIEWGTKAGNRPWRGSKARKGTRARPLKGHPGTPASPVLFPAFEQHRPEVAPRINAAIDKVLANLSSGPND